MRVIVALFLFTCLVVSCKLKNYGDKYTQPETGLIEVNIVRKFGTVNDVNSSVIYLAKSYSMDNLANKITLTCPCYSFDSEYSRQGPVLKILSPAFEVELLPGAEYEIRQKSTKNIKIED